MAAEKTYEYLACPFCGKTTFVDNIKRSTLENFDISWETLQVRKQYAGPGRGKRKGKIKKGDYGFKLIREECLNIVAMSQDLRWKKLSKKVAERVALIYDAYRDAGLIEEGVTE